MFSLDLALFLISFKTTWFCSNSSSHCSGFSPRRTSWDWSMLLIPDDSSFLRERWLSYSWTVCATCSSSSFRFAASCSTNLCTRWSSTWSGACSLTKMLIPLCSPRYSESFCCSSRVLSCSNSLVCSSSFKFLIPHFWIPPEVGSGRWLSASARWGSGCCTFTGVVVSDDGFCTCGFYGLAASSGFANSPLLRVHCSFFIWLAACIRRGDTMTFWASTRLFNWSDAAVFRSLSCRAVSRPPVFAWDSFPRDEGPCSALPSSDGGPRVVEMPSFFAELWFNIEVEKMLVASYNWLRERRSFSSLLIIFGRLVLIASFLRLIFLFFCIIYFRALMFLIF